MNLSMIEFLEAKAHDARLTSKAMVFSAEAVMNIVRTMKEQERVITLYRAAEEHELMIKMVDAPQKITGNTSDGFHTFNELYTHRGYLFAMICADHLDIAWKSRRHSDGSMFDGMFLAGINTPYGQATYHMDVDPFWDVLKVLELPAAPEWDGHTPTMALERIAAMANDLFITHEHGVVSD